MSIGERLKLYRKTQKLKLREVSEQTGLSISFISDIEHGRVLPSLQTCQRFCYMYHVPLSTMFINISIPFDYLK